MVDVTNRPYVAVRLITIKFLFRHFLAPYVSFVSAGVTAPRLLSLGSL